MSGVWPGPPLKLWSTSERALVASANGPPASLAGMTTVSWTKKLPVGVGVEVLTFVWTKLTLVANRFLAPALREAGYRVACTDLRGRAREREHGSPRPILALKMRCEALGALTVLLIKRRTTSSSPALYPCSMRPISSDLSARSCSAASAASAASGVSSTKTRRRSRRPVCRTGPWSQPDGSAQP